MSGCFYILNGTSKITYGKMNISFNQNNVPSEYFFLGSNGIIDISGNFRTEMILFSSLIYGLL